jgi:ATP-dependent Clp protease adaptor protein ClpS
MSLETIVVRPSTPQARRRRKNLPADAKPKKQPPYAVIVHNDDLHTFQYVIETFTKVFGYPLGKGYALALEIHCSGRAIVWSGSLEVAELKRDQIRSAGPDFYAIRKVDFPLGVTIEPLPG